MRLTIDTKSKKLTVEDENYQSEMDLYSDEAFELISHKWVEIGWNQKHLYTFAWMGRPVIQLPDDMLRMQEVIYRVKPDVIVETGVAHGGSLIFYASLLKAMEKGRVIGIDIEIRPHNRKAIEAHELFPLITLVEGSSTDPSIVNLVKSNIQPGEKVLVILDSDHSKQHVLNELDAYHDIVTKDSYIVATDGITKHVYDAPRGFPDWVHDNPSAAAIEFAQNHPEFVIEQPSWDFNESTLENNLTHWPDAWLKRIR